MRIGSIVIRCYEFDKMAAFWQEALHYVPREPAKGGWVVLRDPHGQGPNISLDKYPEKRTGKRSRVHLDLYTEDREGEVERLLNLEPAGIRGGTALEPISSSWKTQTAISSASSKRTKASRLAHKNKPAMRSASSP